jgi:nicotinamidase/pyrazinamidase
MTPEAPPRPVSGDALVVVDMQRDFLPGGALAVPAGDQVIEPLNRAIDAFARAGLPVFYSRDWHPSDHCSFKERGGPWPPHCVANTSGADFAPGLRLLEAGTLISRQPCGGRRLFRVSGTNRRSSRQRISANSSWPSQAVHPGHGPGRRATSFKVQLLTDAVRATKWRRRLRACRKCLCGAHLTDTSVGRF